MKKDNKGSAPNKAWEMHYSMSKFAKSKEPLHNFDPRKGKDRSKLYNKTNETDH